MYLFKFTHSNYFAKTLTQYFYIAQSQKLWRPARAEVRSRNSCREVIRRRRIYAAAEYLFGGGIMIRGGRSWTTNSKKLTQCRKPTHSTQHYLNTLLITYPTLMHRGEDPSRLSDAIACLNTWRSSAPLAVLLADKLLKSFFVEIISQCQKQSHWAENTLFHIPIHWNELYPILIRWAEPCPILIHYRRQPIKFEYCVNRVVSQSESTITSPKNFRHGCRSLLGSQLYIAYPIVGFYSLFST